MQQYGAAYNVYPIDAPSRSPHFQPLVRTAAKYASQTDALTIDVLDEILSFLPWTPNIIMSRSVCWQWLETSRGTPVREIFVTKHKTAIALGILSATLPALLGSQPTRLGKVPGG